MRRMPNLVKFQGDPDAMLVMSLEDYDEMTGKPPRPPSCTKTSWAAASPSRPCTAEEGLLVSLNTRGAVDIPYIASLYSGSPRQVIDELGDLIYQDPESGAWQTADAYLSGNVRAKPPWPRRPVRPTRETWRPCAPSSPKMSCPARRRQPGRARVPATDIQAFAAELRRAVLVHPIGHFKKDALWSVDADVSVKASVPPPRDYGTDHVGGVHCSNRP